MEPSPAKPGLHRHWFCEVDSAVELAFVGHVFCTFAAHHEPGGQARHWPPER